MARPVHWCQLLACIAGFSACQMFLEVDPTEEAPADTDGAPPIDASYTDLTASADAAHDAPVDALPDVAPGSFALVLAPAHVTLDPDGNTDVNINVVRGAENTDAIDVTFQKLGSDIIINPQTLTIPSNQSTASFNIKIVVSAVSGNDFAPGVLGISKRDPKLSASADLGVRVGTLFKEMSNGGHVPLPAWATELVVKAWGAGGGAGGPVNSATGVSKGGVGGGGGFAAARIKVDPSLPLDVEVGTGGASGMPGPGPALTPRGGGGGGYSSVGQGTSVFVIAGGGGGGGGGQGLNHSGVCYGDYLGPYIEGLGGGGGDAQLAINQPSRSATTYGGGVGDTQRGASSGSSLMGANAANPTIFGGVPGGGKGGDGTDDCQTGGGGGGGGGGFFGGASGVGMQGWYQENFVGGGGGSGMIAPGTEIIAQAAATYATPAGTTDVDYNAVAGQGGATDTGTFNYPSAGAGGRVVLRFVSP